MRLIGNLPHRDQLEHYVRRIERELGPAAVEDAIWDFPRRQMPPEGTRCGDRRAVLTLLDDIGEWWKSAEIADRVMARLGEECPHG